MAKFGDTFLTRPYLYTMDEEWAEKSRMQFRETNSPNVWALSPLGIINGLPILSRYFRLAATVDEETDEIHGWKVVRWR